MESVNKGKSTTIVILDDHPVILRGLQEFLEDEPDLEVVETTQNLDTFLKIVEEKEPDIAIVDLILITHSTHEEKNPSGIEAIRRVQTLKSPPRCIAYTAFPGHGLKAIEAGASSYILKNTPMDEILMAIRTNAFVASDGTMPRELKLSKSTLTRRQLEVLCKWVNHPELTRKGIARELNIKEGTVRTHLRDIYAKLEVYSRAEAVKKAHELNLC